MVSCWMQYGNLLNKSPDKLFSMFLVQCTVILHSTTFVYTVLMKKKKKESYQMIYIETNIHATILLLGLMILG